MTRYKRWFTSVNRAIVAEMAMQKKTQKQLAQELGIHPATMNRKLKNPGQFFLAELGQVCEHLNIDLKNPSEDVGICPECKEHCEYVEDED
jgi:DNA-binding Xre family transcriptional regulator